MLVYPRYHGLDQLEGIPHLFFREHRLREWIKADLERRVRSNEYTSTRYAEICGFAWLHYDGDVVKVYVTENTMKYVQLENDALELRVKLWK